MAKDLEELVLSISADNRQMLRALKRIEGDTTKTTRDVERRFDAMAKNIDGRLSGIGKNAFRGLVGGALAAVGTRELVRLADTWTDLQSRIRNAVGDVELGDEALGRLSDTARRTYSALEGTVDSFINNARPLRDMGYAMAQQLDYTEALNNALVISNARGQRAASVQDALAKAMAGGKLQGQELNTVIQTGGRVAEALADGLGVTVSELRALGAAGKITGRDVVKALTSQMETLRAEAEAMPATISDGFQLLQNALLEYVGNGDQATGVSAKISEALVIMADNFDTTADAGLRLAAIIGAGLLGRSITNMVRTLGTGSSALVQFTRAASAARTVGALQAAVTGLSAAAGPAGVVVSAGLAAAFVVAQANAQAAEERTARLADEFDRLGLRGRQGAEGVDEVSEALDRVADEKRVQLLQDINHELERMRGSGSWNMFGDSNAPMPIGAVVRSAGNALLAPTGTDTDRAAITRIMETAAAYRDVEISAKAALAIADDIGRTDISQPVRDLNEQLVRSVEHFSNIEVVEFANGQTSQIDEVIAALIQMTDQYDTIAMRQVVTDDQLNQIDSIRDRLKEGGEAANDAAAELLAFANSNPDFAGLASALNPLIERLNLVIARTNEAASVVAGGGGAGPQTRSGAGQARRARQLREEEGRVWEQEQLRRAQLGKDQLALENEIARVRKQAADDGIRISDDQIRRIAEANLAGNTSRSTEGRKPKSERVDEYERLAERIAETTANMVNETEVLRMLDPLVEDYGYALEKARAEQDLLNAAQKAGVEITPQLREQIAGLAGEYATATVEAAKLGETQDEIRRKAEEMRDFQKDLTRSLVDGFIQGKKAGDMLAETLTKIGNKLLDMAFDGLFDSKGGIGNGGGLLGGLFKMLGFREHGGPVQKGQPYIVGEKRPELFVPNQSGTIVPRVPTMPSVAKPNGGGISVSLTLSPSIDNRGASSEAVAKTAMELDKLKAELPSRVTAAVRAAQSGRML